MFKKNIFLSLIIILTSCSRPIVKRDIIYDEKNFNVELIKDDENKLIKPDGISTVNLKLKINNYNNYLQGLEVKFKVLPVNPSSEKRNLEYIGNLYDISKNIFIDKVKSNKIKLIGTLNIYSSIINQNSEINLKYTSSHIGSNSEENAKERVVAEINGKVVAETEINLGYDTLVEIPTVKNGLKTFKANGVYINYLLTDFLLNLGYYAYNNKWKYPIIITAASYRWGGLYPPHFGHRDGGSIDFAVPSFDENPAWCNTNGNHSKNYDKIKTLALIDLFKKSGAQEIYFNDPDAKDYGATPYPNHHNHIHVSWTKNNQLSINNEINIDEILSYNLKRFKISKRTINY
jgi:hypothetical protein